MRSADIAGILNNKFILDIMLDGKWILQPEWVISAKEVMLDSLSRKMDSLQKNFRKIYPAQQ